MMEITVPSNDQNEAYLAFFSLLFFFAFFHLLVVVNVGEADKERHSPLDLMLVVKQNKPKITRN